MKHINWKCFINHLRLSVVANAPFIFSMMYDGFNLKVIWDDNEEQRYRDWVRDIDQARGEEAGKHRKLCIFLLVLVAPNVWLDLHLVVIFSLEPCFISLHIWHLLSDAVDWSEYRGEEAYRERLREQQEQRENRPVVWSDEMEREYRRKYIELRYDPVCALQQNTGWSIVMLFYSKSANLSIWC